MYIFIFIYNFLASLVLSANTSSTTNSATPTQISEGRQNGLESCLLAGLLIQTEISSMYSLKLKVYDSEKIVPVDSTGLSTLVCNQTRGTCCSNT